MLVDWMCLVKDVSLVWYSCGFNLPLSFEFERTFPNQLCTDQCVHGICLAVWSSPLVVYTSVKQTSHSTMPLRLCLPNSGGYLVDENCTRVAQAVHIHVWGVKCILPGEMRLLKWCVSYRPLKVMVSWICCLGNNADWPWGVTLKYYQMPPKY